MKICPYRCKGWDLHGQKVKCSLVKTVIIRVVRQGGKNSLDTPHDKNKSSPPPKRSFPFPLEIEISICIRDSLKNSWYASRTTYTSKSLQTPLNKKRQIWEMVI